MSYSQQPAPHYAQPYQPQYPPMGMPMPQRLPSVLWSRILGGVTLLLAILTIVATQLPFYKVKFSSSGGRGSQSFSVDLDFSLNPFYWVVSHPDSTDPKSAEAETFIALMIVFSILTVLIIGALFLAAAKIFLGRWRKAGAAITGVSGVVLFVMGLVAKIKLDQTAADAEDVIRNMDGFGSFLSSSAKADIGAGSATVMYLVIGVLLVIAGVVTAVFARPIPRPTTPMRLFSRIQQICSLVAVASLLLPWYVVEIAGAEGITLWLPSLTRLPSFELKQSLVNLGFSGKSVMISMLFTLICLGVATALSTMATDSVKKWVRFAALGSSALATVFALWNLIATSSVRRSLIKEFDDIPGTGRSTVDAISEAISVGAGPGVFFVLVLAALVMAVLSVVLKTPQEKAMQAQYGYPGMQPAYPGGQPGFQPQPYGQPMPQAQQYGQQLPSSAQQFPQPPQQQAQPMPQHQQPHPFGPPQGPQQPFGG